MKIAFSARGLSVLPGGAHEFIKSVIPALAKERGNDELFIIYNDQKYLGLAPDCNEIVIKGNNKIWWDFVLLPKMLHNLKIDAAIFPKNVIPFFVGCKCYVIIHDLAYFDRKLNAYPILDTLYMRTLIPRSVSKAAGVFAVSDNTKREIIRYTRCDCQKIIITYEAANEIYRPIEDKELLIQVRCKYALPEKFIMYVGSLSPRKNIIRLLEAFCRLRQKIPHNLVLTGSKSWKDAHVFEEMKRLGIESRINKLGYVDCDDMPSLYNLADAYVYPSLYEGFGLPVLEAMQCGCPVIASNATSIPEVAGEAAVLVDPYDVDALAGAIYRVLTDDLIKARIVKAGFEQARNFSWQKCAKIILERIRQNSEVFWQSRCFKRTIE